MKNKYNVKELEEKLDRCRNVNLGDVTLDDVDKNPYIFKVNGKLVRIRFLDTDKTAEDCLTRVLENLYR